MIGADTDHPAAFTTLRRRQHRAGAGPRGPGRLRLRQPELGGLPGHPAAATSAPGRTPGCAGAATRPPAASGRLPRPGHRPGLGRRPGHRHADLHLARQLGQHGAVLGRRHPGRPGPHQPGPQLRVPVHRPVAPGAAATRRCSPPPSATTPTPPIANLFAMHNRMHDWAVPARLHRGGLEPAGGQPQPGRPGRRRRAGPRPAGRAERQPEQRQPGHRRATACRRPPTCTCGSRRPAGVPAVRGRRLRHDGDRPRVHPRDHQPDDRRPGQPASAATRAGRWASRGATCSPPSTSSRTGCARPARRPSSPAATSPATWSAASATTTSAAARSTTPTSATTPVGPEVHADGEIWGATNFRVRAGPGQAVRPGHPAAAARLRAGPGRGRHVPGQPALVAAGVRLVPAPGGQPGQHARHARQHARRRPGSASAAPTRT